LGREGDTSAHSLWRGAREAGGRGVDIASAHQVEEISRVENSLGVMRCCWEVVVVVVVLVEEEEEEEEHCMLVVAVMWVREGSA
jgi:hypothetical protein